jgi:cystathionine gamma-synthase
LLTQESAVLNPEGRYFELLKTKLETDYEDNYWAEDAIFMERNSRDFVSRSDRVNTNAESICDVLQSHPKQVKEVYYPKISPTKKYYDDCRNSKGGYGGLLSITFFSTAEAVTFFDSLETEKGPSLGTNFTLTSPFVLLAHYGELDWVK